MGESNRPLKKAFSGFSMAPDFERAYPSLCANDFCTRSLNDFRGLPDSY